MKAKVTKVEKVVDPEWSAICEEFCNTKFAVTEAFLAVDAFNATVPNKGYKGFEQWMDKNGQEVTNLEMDACEAARAYVAACDRQQEYFDRENAEDDKR